MLQLMHQMMQMMEQMNTLQQKIYETTNSAPPSSTSTLSSSSSLHQWYHQTNISHYCWSHGACAHPSSECKSKQSGHQDSATFDNKMGGSTAYCPPASTWYTRPMFQPVLHITKLNIPVINVNDSSYVSAKNTQHIPILKGDSGTTNHYLSSNIMSVLKNVHENDSINVSLLDNSILTSTHSGYLLLP